MEDIISADVYPSLSVAEVRAALHYSIDHPNAVKRSLQPRDTSMKLDVSFSTREGGPTLSVFDLSSDDPGAIAKTTISVDDLPDGYDEQDLHVAWEWMFETRDRPCIEERPEQGREPLPEREDEEERWSRDSDRRPRRLGRDDADRRG